MHLRSIYKNVMIFFVRFCAGSVILVKTKRRQSKTSTSRNVDKPTRRQTFGTSDKKVDKPKGRHDLCGYSCVMTCWFSATVLVDGFHWSHRCLRQICQVFDGVVPRGSSLRWWFEVVLISFGRCLNHRIVVCGTLKRLAPSAVLKLVCSKLTDLSLKTMVMP